MRHFTPPARPVLPPTLLGPLDAAGYLALRIGAAGYTLDTFARAVITVQDHDRPVPAERPTVGESRLRFRQMRNDVALATRRGARLRNPELVDLVAKIIPFDPAVYRQLASEVADRHPPICRSCGCSGNDPCIHEDDVGEHVCRTVVPGLCSRCAKAPVAIGYDPGSRDYAVVRWVA